MKKKIKLFFCDFWPVFKPEDNFILDFLSSEFEVTVSSENPDFIIYSVFGTDYARYNCPRIFYTGENIRPNFDECDFSFSFDRGDAPKNFRWPLYTAYADVNILLDRNRPVEEIMKEKTKFCNFIYSNAGPQNRIEFFKKLSKYKKVDSAGRIHNNCKIRTLNKLDFVREYKFSISFENEAYPGYTTEKIFEPLLVDSLPIYWGDPTVGLDFNTKAILNWYDYGSDEALIEKIIEVDKDDSLWAEYLSQPKYPENKLTEYTDPRNIMAQFQMIFNSNVNPVALSAKTASDNALVKALALAQIDAKFKLTTLRARISNFNLMKLQIRLRKELEKRGLKD